MSYFKKHKEGLVLTILFHAALFLILLKFGFFTPLPLPEDKGVLVDFGITDVGMGKIEPQPKSNPVNQPQPEEKKEQVTPPEPVKSTPAPTEPKTSGGKEEVMTQDYEQTAAIDEGKKKKEEEDKKKRDEEARKKKLEDEKKRKEELEKQRVEELARKEREAKEQRRRDSLQKIENARLAEERRVAEQRRQDSLKRAAEQAKIDEINKRAQNVFGGSGSNTSSSNSSGQGVTYQPGNQGTTTGTPGANKYGLGGGEGISFNLTGRSAESLPKPTYPGQEEGVVVVQVTVDKYGKVTKAEAGVKGSTSLDQGLLNAAKRAAMTARFNEDVNAPAFQTGTITYRFVLN